MQIETTTGPATQFQRALLVAAICAGLVPATHASIARADATQARAQMSINAIVGNPIRIRALHQAQNLVVTAADAIAGYMSIAGGSRFELRHIGTCLFEFRNKSDIVQSARMSAFGSVAVLDSAAGTTLRHLGSAETLSVSIDYHFKLAAGVRAGVYRWPLQLTVLPM